MDILKTKKEFLEAKKKILSDFDSFLNKIYEILMFLILISYHLK